MNDVLAQAMADSSTIKVQNETLKAISTLAQRQLSLMGEVATAEDKVSELKEKLKKIVEIDLPNAMIEAGMREFKLVDGSAVKIKKVYGANIKVEFRHITFAQLVQRGHAGLIKTRVITEFGKGERERKEATKFATDLVEDGFRATLDESIHPQTLKAFVREQLELKASVEEKLLSPTLNEEERKELVEQRERYTLPETITVFIGEQAEIVEPKK